MSGLVMVTVMDSDSWSGCQASGQEHKADPGQQANIKGWRSIVWTSSPRMTATDGGRELGNRGNKDWRLSQNEQHWAAHCCFPKSLDQGTKQYGGAQGCTKTWVCGDFRSEAEAAQRGKNLGVLILFLNLASHTTSTPSRIFSMLRASPLGCWSQQ